jgi:small nuclear ribonucleoprotein
MVLPIDLLEASKNREVALRLKDGRILTGKLLGYDQYMNLVIDEAREKKDDEERRLGKIVLRGSNVVSIAIA